MCVFANIDIARSMWPNTFVLINPLLDMAVAVTICSVVLSMLLLPLAVLLVAVIIVVVYVGIFWFIGGQCVCVCMVESESILIGINTNLWIDTMARYKRQWPE